MAMILKFRINKTLTAMEEQEMSNIVENIKNYFEGELVSLDNIFYVEYHFTTDWQTFQDVSKLIADQSHRHYIYLI